MYKPNSLDQERLSWRTVIYFNVVHSLKYILDTLETWEDVLDDDNDSPEEVQSMLTKKAKVNGIADQPSPSTSLMDASAIQSSPSSVGHSIANGSSNQSLRSKDVGALQIANLRRRLSTLVATDSRLADRLSGGVDISGSGKGGVYVRSGWQARTIENALGKSKKKHTPTVEKKTRESLSEAPPDAMVQEVAHLLEAFEEDIHDLWNHPTVKGMIAKRRLKLDEWSEL
jgi:guanine nucleotide-binding protein subunit alpha